MKIILLIIMALAIGWNIYTGICLVRQYVDMNSKGTAHKWQPAVVYGYCLFSGFVIGQAIISIYDSFQQ